MSDYLNADGTPKLDTIHNADALELLRALPDGCVNAVITDPPYGLFGAVMITRPDTGGEYNRINEEWDKYAPISWMAECGRILKPGGSVLCFGVRQSIYSFANEGLRLGWRLLNDITWYKPDATPNFTGRLLTESTERILWFCPDGKRWTYNREVAKQLNGGVGLRDVWTFGQTREERINPAQKPLALMERIVKLFTRPGDVVVDPFAGGGTTLQAARINGRHYIGSEIRSEQVNKTRARLGQAYTPDMFDAIDTPAPPRVVQRGLFEEE